MLFYAPNITQSPTLPHDEAKHAFGVLRLPKGENIQVTDGAGNIYTCTIQDPKTHTLQIQTSHPSPHPKPHTHLAIAPTKSRERMEWLIEKAVEIGVDQITLLSTTHSQRHHYNSIDRLQRIAISAMKQSQKAWLPPIHPLTPLHQVLLNTTATNQYIAHVRSDCGERTPLRQLTQAPHPPQTPTIILIGPEGDFTQQEVQHALTARYTPVSLHHSILRTETAALVALTLLSH